jgi:hypothetical protein
VTIYSPFLVVFILVGLIGCLEYHLLTGLQTIKIIAPYVILSAAFAKLNHNLLLPPSSLFVIALSMTDGQSISRFEDH